VTDSGVGEGAVQAAVARTEAAVAPEAVLQEEGEVRFAAGGVADRVEEFAEDFELAVGAVGTGNGAGAGVGRRHGEKRREEKGQRLEDRRRMAEDRGGGTTNPH